MAFFRKYYTIFDVAQDNTRIGLVGGQLPAGYFAVEKEDEDFALPDFYGLLFLTIIIVILLCLLLLIGMKTCCKDHKRIRYSLPIPVIKKKEEVVAQPSPFKP